eukprot:CAMPEP_0206001202 /NCGR_PEP_ID=MMETSP1464-20131121/1960_1 /ASSEMBLY_ACC=CAM_ASM_001124 /TAXON_ID=119497 /ORGANISM="Exanthemachrysis gayraliae, Strain RCC1523" /LENGTH=119 /DNA_ID=CAMNT_0053374493 /DNA_START=177 /DNA_END=534 /DNA_ORIENTATION=+
MLRAWGLLSVGSTSVRATTSMRMRQLVGVHAARARRRCYSVISIGCLGAMVVIRWTVRTSPGGAPLAAQAGDVDDGAAAAHGAGVLASSPARSGGVEGIPVVERQGALCFARRAELTVA